MAGYIGNQAQIRSGLSATIDELNIIDGVTATTAELNILDGVTSTATELNILDGVTATTAELNIMDGVTATTAELNIMDGVTATTAELNILDGVTATAAEINLIDGGTARGTTAVADGDGFLTNDGGTMRMTKVDTLATYMGTKIGGGMHEFINETTVSDSASYAFTAMDSSKYKSYVLYVYNLVTATNAQQIKARTSPDGTNFDSGSADYSWRLNYSGGSTSDTTANYARIGQSSSDNANTGYSGTITILDPHNTSTETRVIFEYMNHFGAATGAPEVGEGGFLRVTAEASLGLQLFAASGNITSAKVTAYGITNS